MAERESEREREERKRERKKREKEEREREKKEKERREGERVFLLCTTDIILYFLSTYKSVYQL